MEIQWVILWLTAWVVVAIAVGGIIHTTWLKPDAWAHWRRTFAPLSNSTTELTRSTLNGLAPQLARIADWYARVRKPVFPFSERDIQGRLRMGFRVAFWMTLIAIGIAAIDTGKDWGLAVLVFGFPFAMAITAAASFVHTITLRLLPVRGILTSILLALLMGFIAAHKLARWYGGTEATQQQTNWILAASGFYGLILGLIEERRNEQR